MSVAELEARPSDRAKPLPRRVVCPLCWDRLAAPAAEHCRECARALGEGAPRPGGTAP